MNNPSRFDPKSSPPQFIQGAVLQRLHEGAFVPNRRSKPGSVYLGDRRDTLSPLAVSKRCIRYEPILFENRLDDLLYLVDGLNNPEKRLLMISGDPQTGKTALIRGVIELMGGGPEQVFWFDTMRHSDFDEIIRFLMDSIYSVCYYLSLYYPGAPHEASPWRTKPATASPGPLSSLQQIKSVLSGVSHIPILVVVDNIHFLVDPQQRFNSAPFKELLNFLLSFSNIKLMLAGENLPYGDLNPALEEILELPLRQFSWPDFKPLLRTAFPTSAEARDRETDALLEQIARYSNHSPWQIKTLLQLVKNHPAATRHAFLVALENHLLTETRPDFATILFQIVSENLSASEKAMLTLLAFFRHPIHQTALQDLFPQLAHPMDPHEIHAEMTPEHFQDSAVRTFIRKTFPPQWVSQSIGKNPQLAQNLNSHGFKSQGIYPWLMLHPDIRQAIYQQLPADERARIHGIMADFYLREKNKLRDARRYPVKGKYLEAEAKYHQEKALQESALLFETESAQTAILEKNAMAETVIKMPFGQEIHEIRPILTKSGREAGFPLKPTTESGLPVSIPEPMTVYMDGPESAIPAMWHPPGSFDLEGWREMSPVAKLPRPSGQETENTLQSLYQEVIADGSEEEAEIQARLAEAVLHQNHSGFGKYLLMLAQYCIRHDQRARAEACLRKAMTLEAELPAILLADILTELAILYKDEYHHDTALDYYQQAEELLDSVPSHPEGKTLTLGLIYEGYGSIAAFRQEYEKARGHYQRALECFQTSQQSGLEVQTLIQLAQSLERDGHFESALNTYEQSLTLDTQLGNRLSCIETFIRMGELCLKLQSYRRAVRYFKHALALNPEKAADYKPELYLAAIEQLGYAYVCLDRMDQSEIFYKEGLERAQQFNIPLWQATFYHKLGYIAEIRKQFLDAAAYYAKALSLAEKAELSEKSVALLRKNIQDVTDVLRAS